MSTEQLKALRDATIAYYGAKMSSDLVAICGRAIASLEADEQPEPCACGGGAGTSGWSHSIHGCHHLPKPPAEQAQQPALVDVPPMPQVLAFEETVDGPDFGCAEDAVRALHAACVRIAAERDEARRELEAVKEDKRCALDLLAQERAGRPGSINAMTITSLRERLAEAEAELAALKGQHEAALAQARREGLREALALVERDMKRAAAMGAINAVWPALNEAADGIRALAEKGGKVGK